MARRGDLAIGRFAGSPLTRVVEQVNDHASAAHRFLTLFLP